jgi:hypothetical protein
MKFTSVGFLTAGLVLAFGVFTVDDLVEQVVIALASLIFILAAGLRRLE